MLQVQLPVRLVELEHDSASVLLAMLGVRRVGDPLSCPSIQDAKTQVSLPLRCTDYFRVPVYQVSSWSIMRCTYFMKLKNARESSWHVWTSQSPEGHTQ